MMPFRDRIEAGQRLGRALADCKTFKPVVLALPRGGVPVAIEVARTLEAPLDLVLVRKLSVPMQPELAMGAVAEGPQPVIVRNGDIIRQARRPVSSNWLRSSGVGSATSERDSDPGWLIRSSLSSMTA
jgi:predicted phosphoribosyltransferase